MICHVLNIASGNLLSIDDEFNNQKSCSIKQNFATGMTCYCSRLLKITGVIEGACRHLINDRLDITGARWGLQCAEAILKLRSINSSGDFQKYWTFYKQKSKQRLYDGIVDAS